MESDRSIRRSSNQTIRPRRPLSQIDRRKVRGTIFDSQVHSGSSGIFGPGHCHLCFSTLVFDWLTPGDMWKDIVVEKNLPLAITLAAMIIAVGNIIAAAIHG
jgi:hypothetical protein